MESLLQVKIEELKKLGKELNEYSSYKSAYDYMKEEVLAVKSQANMLQLELEQA